MNESNPYAPPMADLSTPIGGEEIPRPVTEEELAAARQALRAYLVESDGAARDQRLDGPLLRGGSMVAWVLALMFILGSILEAAAMGDVGLSVLLGFLAVLAAVIGGFLTWSNLATSRERNAGSPERALKAFFHSARARDWRRFIISIVPNRRDFATPPRLSSEAPPLPMPLGDKRGILAYLKRWARGNGKKQRTISYRNFQVVDQRGDLAWVRFDLTISEWPMWAIVVGTISFLAIRLVGLIVLVVLHFTTRKVFKSSYVKTLLRGPDGKWYVLDGSVHR